MPETPDFELALFVDRFCKVMDAHALLGAVAHDALVQLSAQVEVMRQHHPDWFDEEGYLKDA